MTEQNQSKFEAGVKFDGDKLKYDRVDPAFWRMIAEIATREELPFHLWAPEAIEGTTRVLKFGAEKYEERNWERGFALSRPYAALLRHMVDAWAHGEDYDPETGFAHVWQGMCSIMFIGALWMRGVGEDDRKTQPAGTPASGGGVAQYEAIGLLLGCDRDEARARVRGVMAGKFNLYDGLAELLKCDAAEAKKMLRYAIDGNYAMAENSTSRQGPGTPEDGGHHAVGPTYGGGNSDHLLGSTGRERFGAWNVPNATSMPRANALGHRTRMSDSSVFDEICVLCGATDGIGNVGLRQRCPNACSDQIVDDRGDFVGMRGTTGPVCNCGKTE